MSKKLFNKKEMEILSRNQYVKNVTEKEITYTDEFKKIFVRESNKGLIGRNIFESNGFDVDIIGIKRIHSSIKDGELRTKKTEKADYKIHEREILEDQEKKIYH